MYLRAKKRLGQNFLIDKNIQAKIINACEITGSDTVLEIGAGKGELTRLIAERANRVFALELDKGLYSVLKQNLGDGSPSLRAQVNLLNQDILKFDIGKHFRGKEKIKVVGNLPYYITTPIIAHLLESHDKIQDIFITVQREFARRMIAFPGTGDWSALSCFLQYYTEPKLMFIIKRTCFRPQPNVDSALVRLCMKDKFYLDAAKESRLFRIIRLSFQQRRKMLKNALSGTVSAGRLDRYFKQYNINKEIRGEELSLQDFINLVNIK